MGGRATAEGMRLRPEDSSGRIDTTADTKTTTSLSRKENKIASGDKDHGSSGRDSENNQAVHLKFDDNSLVSLLCGEHDRYLVHMEKALGISIVLRGNFFSITESIVYEIYFQ